MSTGVKQDSIEGPTLWNIFYTFLLLDWVKRYKEELGDSGGVSFEYSLDGALWTGENNAKRGSHTSNINDLEYEDDLVVFETDPAQKQNRCMKQMKRALILNSVCFLLTFVVPGTY